MPEVLVAIGAVGFVLVFGVGVLRSALCSSDKVREIQAGRSLVLALQASATENNGRYLPGMDYRVGTSANPVYKVNGDKLTGHAAQRYPFRLAPYLDGRFDGTILLSRNKVQIEKSASGSASMYDYLVSTFPALGMNIFCVGGVVRADGTLMNEAECISHSGAMRGGVLAFASGGKGEGKNKQYGFSYVSPPTKQNDSPVCLRWDSAEAWSDTKDPMNYGWVDFRYNGRAVCAFLDGTVRLCNVEELSDMRLWTHAAIEADDPDYELAR